MIEKEREKVTERHKKENNLKKEKITGKSQIMKKKKKNE